MNGEDDSFFISVDSGDYALWDTQQSQSWLWDRVNDRGGNDPVVYHLKAGEHMLRIKQREDGTKIDKISITNDPAYVPEGLGNTQDTSAKAPDPPSENIDPADLKLLLEAENGTLTSPFVSASDSKASAGKYAWVPNGEGRNSKPENDAGTIVFTFDIPAAGDYAFWGRVLAKNGRDNSFFVAVDNGDFAAWHVKKSTSWIWDSLKHGSSSDLVMYLEAGRHTLTIKQREDGTKLDKILITNDPSYVPE
jgi:hypothetical protein